MNGIFDFMNQKYGGTLTNPFEQSQQPPPAGGPPSQQPPAAQQFKPLPGYGGRGLNLFNPPTQ
jgi:hypothetical protein